jgi:hypothetical protein
MIQVDDASARDAKNGINILPNEALADCLCARESHILVQFCLAGVGIGSSSGTNLDHGAKPGLTPLDRMGTAYPPIKELRFQRRIWVYGCSTFGQARAGDSGSTTNALSDSQPSRVYHAQNGLSKGVRPQR